MSFSLSSIHEIVTPEDYLKGVCADEIVTARNVLVFQRTRKAELRVKSSLSYQHHRYLLLIPLEGTGVVHVDGLAFQMKPRNALLIHSFQVHFYSEVSEGGLNWLFITFEHSHPFLLERFKDTRFQVEDRAFSTLSQMLEYYLKVQEGALQDPSIIVIYMELLLRQLSLDDRKAPARELRSERNLLNKIYQVIRDDFSVAERISSLAQSCGFSESHLRTEFRKQTGMSLGSYLRRIRIERACALLVNSSERISEIANDCGYHSIYSFSRSFKNEVGETPTDYRKKRQLTL